MIRQRSSRWARAILPLMMAALLVAAGLGPSSSSTFSQRRTTRRTPAKQITQSNREVAQPATIYDRGYLKGYNEGFGQGQGDWGRGVPRDSQHSRAYQQRDQLYEQGFGASEEYTQGFQLGFELGYSDGYYGRARNSITPVNALTLAKAAALADAQRVADRRLPVETRAQPTGQPRGRSYAPVTISNDTEMFLHLISPINTKTNQVGDRFAATVTSPPEFEGATVEGHIASLKRSGRVSGRTELVLAFDTITLRDGRQGPLNADVEKIRENDKVKRVDAEGRIETGNRTQDSEVRGAIGAAAGALIGGLAGGGKGALIGLLAGGGAGVGTVYVEGNNDLVLDSGAEISIRTAGRRQP